MAANADPHRPEPPGTGGMISKTLDGRACVIIVACEFLGDFVGVARFRSRLVVSKDAPDRLQLMPDFRHGDDEPVTRKDRRGPPDGCSDLKYFRPQDDARIPSRSRRSENAGPHRPPRGGKVDGFIIENGHATVRSAGRYGGN